MSDLQRDLQVLLAHTLGKPRAWVLAHPEAPIGPQQAAHLDMLAHRLAQGEPLPYLLGGWEFYGRPFNVNPDVLIPRPETELLVETALDWLDRRGEEGFAADVGTGSGCIAVTLAAQHARLRVVAVDRSRAALRTAEGNAARHGVAERVAMVQGSLLQAFSGPFRLVCANLPYIPSQALDGLPVAQHEPRLALDGGTDGLALIRALIADAPRWLAPGGLLLLEMQYDQSEAIRSAAVCALPRAHVKILPDLAGLPRLAVIENPPTQ
jgi:release factor glutamine methyltransferase